MKKKDQFFLDDEWKAVGNNKRKSLILAMVPLELWTPSLCVKNLIELYEPPKLICLSDYFGLRKDIRLYFSPRQFATMDRIKVYIKERTKGTVIPTGGRPGKSLRFSCKTKHCKFCIWIKWDKFGYYIQHYNHERKIFTGYIYHNH